MTKSEFKTGMLVRTRNGTYLLVVRNCNTVYGKQSFCLLGENMYLIADDYNKNLEAKDPCLDIMKIYIQANDKDEVCVNSSTLDFGIGSYNQLFWTREWPDKKGILSHLKVVRVYQSNLVHFTKNPWQKKTNII